MADWDEDYEEYTLLVTSDFSTHNYELREDYSTELREDTTVELRDAPL